MKQPMFMANAQGPTLRSDDGGATWFDAATGKRVRSRGEKAETLRAAHTFARFFAWLNIGGAAAVIYAATVPNVHPIQFAMLMASVVAVGMLPAHSRA